MKTVRDFIECAECAAKPGTPALCPACLANRSTINGLRHAITDAGEGSMRLRLQIAELKGKMGEQMKQPKGTNKAIRKAARKVWRKAELITPPKYYQVPCELIDQLYHELKAREERKEPGR